MTDWWVPVRNKVPDARCDGCSRPILVGAKARWNRTYGTILCRVCFGRSSMDAAREARR